MSNPETPRDEASPLSAAGRWRQRSPGIVTAAVLALGCVYFVREREFSATRLDRRFSAALAPKIALEDTPAVSRVSEPAALDAAGRPAVQASAKRPRGPLVERSDAGVVAAPLPTPAAAATMRARSPQSQQPQPRKRLGEPQRTLPPRPIVPEKAASENDEDAIWGERR